MRRQVKDRVAAACRGKRVLHIGCCNSPRTEELLRQGRLLHTAIDRVAAEQHGVDLDACSVQVLASYGYGNLQVLDTERCRLNQRFAAGQFDVIVAGEVLEHLSNPGMALANIR
jgi:2-polyprenyl-3-methyl-5-hydroxy-6-metoxy-1,4-benzoquinol methylase